MTVPAVEVDRPRAGGGRPHSTQRLHSTGQRLRAFDARYPLAWDALLTAAVALPSVVGILSGAFAHGGGQGGAGWRGGTSMPVAEPMLWLVAAGMALPLLWRRRYPFAVLCAVAVALLVQNWLGLNLKSVGALGIALYNVALRLPMSWLAWAGAVILTEITVECLHRPPDDFGRTYIPVLAVSVAIVASGLMVRTRRDHLASLVERAARLEIERDHKAQLAAAAERTRIAREMHDIVAHNLSVVVGLADGGSYAARTASCDPERPAQALEAISSTGRQALGELRRLLGVLQDSAHTATAAADSTQGLPELAPQPGLSDLDPLLDRVRAAGLPVRSVIRDELQEQSRGRQLTMYRIVQEALTNALKHGGAGTTAEVTITYADTGGGVDIEVLDTGSGSCQGPGGGQGIRGMRERATVYDGTLDAGPLPHGGWRVHAHLPGGATPEPVPAPRPIPALPAPSFRDAVRDDIREGTAP